MRGRRGWAVFGLVLVGLAIWALRAFTMATYKGTPPGSRTAVSFDVVDSGSPSSREANARALLWPCIADVDSRLVGDISEIAEHRFQAMLQPALDATETKKFLGCLRDTRVAHVRAAAAKMDRVA